MKPKISIQFKLKDGTTYEMDNPTWIKAFKMKVESEGLNLEKDWELIHQTFIDKVDKHWKAKTVPTKFGMDISWFEHLKNNIDFELYCKDDSVHNAYEKKYGKGSYPSLIVPAKFLEESKKEHPGKVILTHDDPKNKFLDELQEKRWKELNKKAEEEAKKKYKPFENQSKLAPDVMYQVIRVPIMGIMFSEMSKGEGKAIGLNKDGSQTIYSKKGFVKIKNEEKQE